MLDNKKGIQLFFHDTGIGINAKNINKLFQIFGKLSDPDKLNNEGTGLGLYITSNLVKQLGGTIQVDSIKDQYTNFIINIPDNSTLPLE